MEISEVKKLVNIINYQEGAVVSKTILDKNTGTITFFAFAEGEGLSEHTAPYAALVQIIDGEAIVEISGKEYKVKEGEMIIMPANEPHSLRAQKKFKMMLVMIKS